MKRFHLYLLSDSTGDTLNSIAKACSAQFKNIEAIEHFWSMIRSESEIEIALSGAEQNDGLVLFTIVNENLRNKVKTYCRKKNIHAIPVLEPVLNGFSSYLQMPCLSQPGRQHRLDHAYFERIDAMDFVLQNDDGQNISHLNDADVLLVGVSRTSKTPTCVYLGNRGIKAANVPFIPNVTDLETLENVKGPVIVALTESPKRLLAIRKSRMSELKDRSHHDYIDLEAIEEEVKIARRFYKKMNWPIIDVTKRSVEETAAEIINLLTRKKDNIRVHTRSKKGVSTQ